MLSNKITHWIFTINGIHLYMYTNILLLVYNVLSYNYLHYKHSLHHLKMRLIYGHYCCSIISHNGHVDCAGVPLNKLGVLDNFNSSYLSGQSTVIESEMEPVVNHLGCFPSTTSMHLFMKMYTSIWQIQLQICIDNPNNLFYYLLDWWFRLSYLETGVTIASNKQRPLVAVGRLCASADTTIDLLPIHWPASLLQ